MWAWGACGGAGCGALLLALVLLRRCRAKQPPDVLPTQVQAVWSPGPPGAPRAPLAPLARTLPAGMPRARPPHCALQLLRPPPQPGGVPPPAAPRAPTSATRSPSLEKDERSPPAAPVSTPYHDAVAVQSPRALDGSRFTFPPAPPSASPRYFTPPETGSPAPSPRALQPTRREGGPPKPPPLQRTRSPKTPRSPRHANKENYFTFEPPPTSRPPLYRGRNSIEREHFTPPAEKEVKKYRRHNSCEANYKNLENVSESENNNRDIESELNKNFPMDTRDRDVVDCCAKLSSTHIETEVEGEKQELLPPNSAQARRQRLKSISLDSDNARLIEQNLGLPIAKQIKDQINEAYKHETSASCESVDRSQKSPDRPMFKFEDEIQPDASQKSPDLKHKSLRHSSDTQSFIDMPRFSPKEFEITVTTEDGATSAADVQNKKKPNKNLRNLTIDLTKRDSDLEKELLEFEKLYTDAEEKKVKTPTLKVKATSLDSSESVNLSLPQKKTLDIPQNSISVPNTPKRQLKRILAQKSTGKIGFPGQSADQRRLYMKGQDSGIYLRDNHASLMLYQPGRSRGMGSFDENTDNVETTPEINISGTDNRLLLDPGQTLGSNLLNYKGTLSVSSTNLKTLPEGVPSDNFDLSAEDDNDKFCKKLHRRNSNQSLMLSLDKCSYSLQGSNCSLSSAGNAAAVRQSVSNFSLNTDNRQTKLSLDRRDSNTSMIASDHITPTTRVICSSNASLSGESFGQSKNCLLQRRGSNNSLTLNILPSTSLSRHSSNSSLNKDPKPAPKKGLLERRSSNTSLTLNINSSNPSISGNKALSISNFNLNGSTCNLSRYNSNHSIDNATVEHKKGILERRSSNTSLTLNLQQEPRDIEIDETALETTLKDSKNQHRKSLSTENLIPKSYKYRQRPADEAKSSFGSHDNLWSNTYDLEPQNLTYVCGDQDNEIIYAFGASEAQQGFTRNITTKPLSPQSTSEDFRLYLANMQHLQNASSVLSRKQLRDLNDVFQNGYSKVSCDSTSEGRHCCSGRVSTDLTKVSCDSTSEGRRCCSGRVSTDLTKVSCDSTSEGRRCCSGRVSTDLTKVSCDSTSEGRRCCSGRVSTDLTKVSCDSTSEGRRCCSGRVSTDLTKVSCDSTSEGRRCCSGRVSTDLTKENPQMEIPEPEFTQPCSVYQKMLLRGLHQEFWDMPTNFQEKPLVSGSHVKNRYKSILPNEHSRVPLRTGKEEGYINANFIKGYECTRNSYIATQGPLPNTMYDFWLMVRQNCRAAPPGDGPPARGPPPVQKIVMLTNFIENNRQKCERYFPEELHQEMTITNQESGDSQSFTVKNLGVINKAGYTIRKLCLRHLSEQEGVTVYHYWFHNWADHKCPKDVNALLNLSLDILSASEYDFDGTTSDDSSDCACVLPEAKFPFPPLEGPSSPCEVPVACIPNISVEGDLPATIVHCSAGIGRTGCLIAILNGMRQLSIELKVDVLGIVCTMRLNRGGMVQNSEQYELIHKVLCLFEQVCLPQL